MKLECIGLVWEVYTLGYGDFRYANCRSGNECGVFENGHGNTMCFDMNYGHDLENRVAASYV